MPTPRPAWASPATVVPYVAFVRDIADEPLAIECKIDDLPAAAVLQHQNQRVPGELEQRHAPLFRERVIGGDDGAQAVHAQHVTRQLAVAVRLAADAEIHLSRLDHRGDRRGDAVEDADGDAGIRLGQLANGARQQTGGHRWQGGDRDEAAPVREQLVVLAAIASTSMRMRSSGTSRSRPACVSATCRLLRSNSFTPTADSSC